jgi:hypothetical protein
VTDDNSEREAMKAGVTALAKKCHYIAKLALMETQEDFNPDRLDDRGKLIYLSIMSQSIAQTLSEQRGCKEISQIWGELTTALNDIADGKNAELFRPLKEVGSQPRRISVHKETYFSIAAAVYDRSEGDEKEEIANEIAKKFKMKPAEFKDYRKNLTRSEPNIRSTEALELYDSVSGGTLCADENGQIYPGTGAPSPVKNWRKWIDSLPPYIEV